MSPFGQQLSGKRRSSSSGLMSARRLASIVLFVFTTSLLAPLSASAPPINLSSLQWVQNFDAAGMTDAALNAVVSPEGEWLYVTGAVTTLRGQNTAHEFGTIAYETSTGRERWMARYGARGWVAEASALDLSPDGTRLYVTGQISDGTRQAGATIAYDSSSGSELWVAHHERPGARVSISHISTSPDGSRLFVAGSATTESTTELLEEYVVFAYDSATGVPAWRFRYDGGAEDQLTDLAVSPDGARVFATGYSVGSDGSTYATFALSASTGGRLWVARYNNGEYEGDDRPSALVVDPNGFRVYVTGGSMGAGPVPVIDTFYDYATVAYDATSGLEVWSARLGLPSPLDDDRASDIAVDPGGSRVYVTGSFSGNPSLDIATVAYDARSGRQLWVARYDAGGDDGGVAISVSPDGAWVYVAGWSVSLATSSGDYATIGYDAARGIEQWAARYEGPQGSDEGPWDIEVSPSGAQVFVTGIRIAPSTGLDWLTVAYCAPSGPIPRVLAVCGAAGDQEF